MDAAQDCEENEAKAWPPRVRFFKDGGKGRYLQPRSLALLDNDCRIRLYIPSIGKW
jgi:hypothetical protein